MSQHDVVHMSQHDVHMSQHVKQVVTGSAPLPYIRVHRNVRKQFCAVL